MLRKQQKVSKYLKRFYKKIIIINQLLKIANEFKLKFNVKKMVKYVQLDEKSLFIIIISGYFSKLSRIQKWE